MQFTNTRDFHTARKQWLAQLPAFALEESELKPYKETLFVSDLDQQFGGKAGTPFPFGTCFYHYRYAKSNEGAASSRMLGFARLLVPHVGALFVVLDDLQALASGGGCLTKTMEVDVFPVGFGLACQQRDMALDSFADFKSLPNNRGTEITTRIEARDHASSQLVATSRAVFILSPSITAVLTNQIKQDMSVLWEKVAHLRLAGEHVTDPAMSFTLTMPRPDLDDVPSWWTASTSSQRRDPLPSPFAGRVDLFNVELLKNGGGVRAVVLPRLTSEGAPSLVHGGATAAACIEVLANLVPSVQVARMEVRFKRRIEVETKIVVEIASQQQGGWTAKILDWNRTVLQEIVLVEHAQPKL